MFAKKQLSEIIIVLKNNIQYSYLRICLLSSAALRSSSEEPSSLSIGSPSKLSPS